MSSAEFRKSYPRLNEPVAVTALGRVIGHYIPANAAIDDQFVAAFGLSSTDWARLLGSMTLNPKLSDRIIGPVAAPTYRKAQQAERDAILRKVNRKG